MSARKQIADTIRKEHKEERGLYNYKAIKKSKILEYRKTEESVKRLDKPSNLPRAKSLGYKAKKGFLVVRVRVRRGGGAHKRPRSGRRPKRMGVNKLTRNISKQRIAELRASSKFPNCEVLNSYYVGEDGKHKYYEVILVDRNAPEIKADKDICWICCQKNRGRAERGLTSKAKKERRGKRKKGK
ncbi:MAG: 50S ribosomal protein L15e [Candidatus Diapherotrites archaeon]|nr:50S ribosomal protein L15e [Candidatus Diapherotrites archaeon]